MNGIGSIILVAFGGGLGAEKGGERRLHLLRT